MVDICHAVIIKLLGFCTQSLGMKPDMDKVMNSWITLLRLYESDEDFNSNFVLGGEKQDCRATKLCVRTEFGQFSLNLVLTSCIPTSSGDEQLIVVTYRRCVNGFTHTDMWEGLFA